MTEHIDPIEYGKLLAQVEHLSTKVDSMEKNVQAMRDLMEQARGGWRALAWLGGAAGVIGGVVGWVLSHTKYTS